MRSDDRIAETNRKHWQREVDKKGGYTVPWLDLDTKAVRQFAKDGVDAEAGPLFVMRPANVLSGLQGKEVLCLASGGGQQSAVFGLLGAHVTVVDLTEGQLRGDRQAAAHYGYEVSTIEADMRDLSALESDRFDFVYQGHSTSWIPDVHEVYSGVARVLKTGGLYRVDFNNPANHFMEWQREAYIVARPYWDTSTRREEGGGSTFRHYFSDIFNGLRSVSSSMRHLA